jgi:hypothetical protein
MSISKSVILDLLPVYLAGDASPETRALVEEYLRQDPDLASRIREQWTQALGASPPAPVPPDLELRSLQRTHGRIWLQILLFGLMLAFLGVFFGRIFAFDSGGLQVLQVSLATWLSFVMGIVSGLAFLSVRLRMRGVFAYRVRR